MKRLRVGQITNTHGVRGGLKVFPLTDYNERFEELEWVYIEGYEEKFIIRQVKYKKNFVILFFKDHWDINAVEKYKGKYLFIDECQRRELPEDTYYISDIIGLEVYTTENVYLGKIMDILQAGSNEVYIIKKDENSQEIMIPAVREFVPEINLEARKVIVSPIEGMIE